MKWVIDNSVWLGIITGLIFGAIHTGKELAQTNTAVKQGSSIIIDGSVYQCKQVNLGGGE